VTTVVNNERIRINANAFIIANDTIEMNTTFFRTLIFILMIRQMRGMQYHSEKKKQYTRKRMQRNKFNILFFCKRH
jgi:hypothetical protein